MSDSFWIIMIIYNYLFITNEKIYMAFIHKNYKDTQQNKRN